MGLPTVVDWWELNGSGVSSKLGERREGRLQNFCYRQNLYVSAFI
jgi:hypothetical protein